MPIALSNDDVDWFECATDEYYGLDRRVEQDFTSFSSVSFESIPASASRRFSKFIRTFQLIPVDPSLPQKISNSSEMAVKAKETEVESANDEEKRRKAKKELEAAGVPQWRLWAISEFSE